MDTAANDFNVNYSSWPFRVWVVDCCQKVVFAGQPTEDGSNLNYGSLRQFIEEPMHDSHMGQPSDSIITVFAATSRLKAKGAAAEVSMLNHEPEGLTEDNGQ